MGPWSDAPLAVSLSFAAVQMLPARPFVLRDSGRLPSTMAPEL